MTGAPYPVFPVKLVGFQELHAAFPNEKPHTWHSSGPRTGNTGICPILADVGFHGRPPVTLYWQQVFMCMVIYTLYSQGPRFVESHICQNRADVGHPSFVTDQAVRNDIFD